MQTPRELRRFMRVYGYILTSLLMIVIALSGIIWGVIPFGQRVLKDYQELGKITAAIKVMEAKYSFISSKNEEELERDASELLRAIPSGKDVASAISTVEQTANSSGLSVESLVVESPGSLATEAAQARTTAKGEDGLEIISSTITVDGSIEQLKAFTDSLHKVRRLLRVKLADVASRDTGVSRANLSIDAYFAPVSVTVGVPTKPIEPLSTAEVNLLNKIVTFPVAYLSLTEVTSGTFPIKQDPFSP